MRNTKGGLEGAVWAAAEGQASVEQLALLDADRRASSVIIERLMDDSEDQLESVQQLRGPERDQVVADFTRLLDGLSAVYDRVNGWQDDAEESAEGADTLDGAVRLQASWADGVVVVWAGGRSVPTATGDELPDLLEAIGGPPLGWRPHAGVPLPGGGRADAVAIAIADALGWLVAAGAGLGGDAVDASVRWLGRVAVAAVRQVASGAAVPTLRRVPAERGNGFAVRWRAALMDATTLNRFAQSMPGPVRVLVPPTISSRAVTGAVLDAVAHAVVAGAAGLLELPAPPPSVRTGADVAEAVVTRLDGSVFTAPAANAAAVADRLDRWVRAVVDPDRPRLVVQLDPPDRSNAWLLSVLAPGPDRALMPVEVAAANKPRQAAALTDELGRLERLLPVLNRPGGSRRGQVYLDSDEAWDVMTSGGETLHAAGFDVRVPALSRRTVKPSLAMFVESGPTAVGAQQLSNVRWSALFDDVELTAAEITKLAAQARPLVQSRGRWVELDRLDLQEAAAALAERAATTTLSGAEILRHAVGLEGSLSGRQVTVTGGGWAAELLEKAAAASSKPIAAPGGFHGTLRSYQADALGWLEFVDTVDLGGCLALDMGLGKTPTMLAHLVRTAGEGPALVIAPPAVVGNWAAEAARFTPSMRVVVHHGATRASAQEVAAEVSGADIVITTYGTAVRDIESLTGVAWRHLILDEAQAIKNPANEASRELRRIDARNRLALTGTPIENGLGDLWSILDFTNPGLVGSRSTFMAQLTGDGESALRALNGILVFRRTKSEPEVAAELPDRIDELDHCTMTREQIGLYQAVLDSLVATTADAGGEPKRGAVLAAITALKQICNHPAAYQDDGRPLAGRSGKLTRLEEIVESVFAAGERILVFTHFAEWGKRLADHLTTLFGAPIACYHGGLARGTRDRLIAEFQNSDGPSALVLSLKAGGTGLNLTAANHVVLYDRWWNPAVEDQARDRAWRIGQTRTVVAHRLVCPGTIDERVEEVVAGKRHVADLVLPKSSSLDDLGADQLRTALGLRPDTLLTEDSL